MKKALLATLIGAAFAADASAAVIDFSYGNGETSFYGFQKKETYDIAVFLPGDSFEGMKLKSVSVPVFAEKGIGNYKDAKVWLSSELKLENKKNAPDIASYDAELAMADDATAQISMTLPEEYTVTADGVYVGYSITVDKLDAGTRYPMALSGGGAAGSFFLHTTTSVKTWQDQAAVDGLSSCLTIAVQADNLKSENVSFVSIPETIYMSLNEDKNVNVTLSTTAGEPVTSVDFEFTVGGVASTCHYELPEAVPAAIAKNFNAVLTIPAQTTKFKENFEVKVAKVNGKSNPSDKAVAATSVQIFEYAPVHQCLMEEYTCTKCGYCTRGFAALEYIKKNYPDFICISYHNSYQGADPMDVGNPPVSISGNPSASFDRAVLGDPYYGTEKYSGLVPAVEDMLAINAEFTPWAIKVDHVWESDDVLTAKVIVTNVLGYESGDYKVGYVLVSDGLSGESSAWTQSNYYSSYAPQYCPELNAFCKGGEYGKSSVKGLVYNDVVISVANYKGIKGSIPASMAEGESVESSMSWNLTEIDPALVPNKNKLRIVAFVLDSKGKIMNSAKQDITDYTGLSVENIASEAVAPVEYYNLNGVKVANPQGGIFIRRQGGKAEKVVIK